MYLYPYIHMPYNVKTRFPCCHCVHQVWNLTSGTTLFHWALRPLSSDNTKPFWYNPFWPTLRIVFSGICVNSDTCHPYKITKNGPEPSGKLLTVRWWQKGHKINDKYSHKVTVRKRLLITYYVTHECSTSRHYVTHFM